MSTHCGIAIDYEHKHFGREILNVWSGAFFSVWEGEAIQLPRADGYMVRTCNGDRVRVTCETPRTNENYQRVDAAISAALNAHDEARGARTMADSATHPDDESEV